MPLTPSTPCVRSIIANPGIIGEVLSDDRITADIIVDGIHVAPEVVKVFLQAKGRERAVLITDAISATGMPDGRYQLGPIEVDVKDGKCTANGSLAGSVLTMDRAVRNVTQVFRLELARCGAGSHAEPSAGGRACRAITEFWRRAPTRISPC